MRTKIEKQVMASVGAIYAFRVLTGSAAVKVYALVISTLCVVSIVSVPNVFHNLSEVGVRGFTAFALAAVVHTQLVVQLALLVFSMALLSLLVDTIRGARTGAVAV